MNGPMTIADFNKVLELMRKIYNFDDQETQLLNVNDPRMGHCPCRVEITTKDKETGVQIVMSRSAYNEEEEKPWES